MPLDPIHACMAPPDRLTPIYSVHTEDPTKADAIDEFVIQLAERIDHLQDAESEGDMARLIELAESLTRDAENVGYADFIRVAQTALDAAQDGKADEAHAALVELTDLSHRIRLGHRGSL